MASLKTKVELYLGREFTDKECFITTAHETKIVKWTIEEKSQPTQEELDALEAEATTKDNNKQAIRNRLIEYPSLGDVVDSIFKKEEGDSTEFDLLATKRQATKATYPKE